MRDESRFTAGAAGVRDRHDDFRAPQNILDKLTGRHIGLGVLAIIVVVFAVTVALVVGSYFSYNNSEARQRNRVEAELKSSQVVFDETWKTIKETFNLAENAKDGFKEVYVSVMQAQNAQESQALLARFVNQVAPTPDFIRLYERAQSTLEAQRMKFTRQQLKLISEGQTHDNMIDTQPSRFFVHTLGGKDKIVIQLVTSGRTRQAFDTGEDNETLIPENKKQ